MGQDPILVMSHTKYPKSDIMSEQPNIDNVCNPGCKASDAIKQAYQACRAPRMAPFLNYWQACLPRRYAAVIKCNDVCKSVKVCV